MLTGFQERRVSSSLMRRRLLDEMIQINASASRGHFWYEKRPVIEGIPEGRPNKARNEVLALTTTKITLKYK
jgi:hypothetical protein